MTALVAPARMMLTRLFARKVRGVRWIDLIGLMLVAAMIFSVYLAKAAAARESADIADLERRIGDNSQRVRLLRAEAARLEQPGRLEALSREAGLAPVDVHRQDTEDGLPHLAPVPEPRPVIVAPTVPTPAAVAEDAR